jgi:putative ABC transport system permease protein
VYSETTMRYLRPIRDAGFMACLVLATCSSLPVAPARGQPAAEPVAATLVLQSRAETPATTATVQQFGLTRDDYGRMVETIPTLQSVIPVRSQTVTVRARGLDAQAKLTGTTPQYADVAALRVTWGRFLTDKDMIAKDNVAVLSASLAEKLFAETDPVGEHVRVADTYLTIVGVVQVNREFLAVKDDEQATADAVYMPISTMRARLGDVVLLREGGAMRMEQYELSQIILRTSRHSDLPATRDAVADLLARTHEREDYEILVPRLTARPSLHEE